MSISFPNTARSYDEANRRVRFLGHDGMFEVRFFVPADMLSDDGSQRGVGEREYLAAFDAQRPRILEAAKSAYSSNRNNMITLERKHLR